MSAQPLPERTDAERVADGHDPAYATPEYRSTSLRAPSRPLVILPGHLADRTGPAFGEGAVEAAEADLTRQHEGEPLGERIVVSGRVLDRSDKPIRNTLVEVWQANAGGRYRHRNDTYIAPIDPNFGGCGRVITDANGYYAFRTVKPGAYPFRNHVNSWRPAHIHFSVFGSGFAQRLITQMYFEGDPLIPRDSILGGIPDPAARQRLVAPLDMNAAIPLDTLAYRFDIVLRGTRSTLFENKLHGN